MRTVLRGGTGEIASDSGRRAPAGAAWRPRRTAPAAGRDNARVATTPADEARRIGIKLAALAQDGLTYAANDFEFPDDEMSKMMGDLSYVRAVYVG